MERVVKGYLLYRIYYSAPSGDYIVYLGRTKQSLSSRLRGHFFQKPMHRTISFDNLAIKQLRPEHLLSDEEWNEFYMGDDGQFTMYIDMVKEQFAMSSTATERWGVMDDIKAMFERVRTR